MDYGRLIVCVCVGGSLVEFCSLQLRCVQFVCFNLSC